MNKSFLAALVLVGGAWSGSAFAVTCSPTAIVDGCPLYAEALLNLLTSTPNGSATTPSISFTNAATTGLFFDPSTPGVGVTVGGAKSGEFTPNGLQALGVYSGNNWLNLNTFLSCDSTEQSTVNSTVCVNTTSPHGETYAYNFGLTSSDNTGDKVALYIGAHALSGSSNVWSVNFLNTFEAGSSGGIISELDLNNIDCDTGNSDGGQGNCSGSVDGIGELITGSSSHTSTTAIQIGGVGSATQWHQGMTFAGSSVDYALLWENTLASRILYAHGIHQYGLDLTNSTFSGSAIIMDLTKSGSQITWNNGTSTSGTYYISVISNDSAMIFGSPTSANGAVELLSNGYFQANNLVAANGNNSTIGSSTTPFNTAFVTSLVVGVGGASVQPLLASNGAGDLSLAATAFNVSAPTVYTGGITTNTLSFSAAPTGTVAGYACFTSSYALVYSATAC